MAGHLPLNPRHWVIRWLTPVVWRHFPARKLSALQEFALVERDSGNQLLDCIPLVSDPKLKAHLFQHVLEETFHGEIFDGVCRELSDKPLPLPMKPAQDLIPDGSDSSALTGMLSYVHVGERAVNRDFLQFAEGISDVRLRKVFLRAGGDEGKHEGDTGDILFALSGKSRFAYARNVTFAQLKRWWILYTAFMRRVGEMWLAVVLSVVYFIFGAVAAGAVRKRFHLSASEQIEAMASQVRDFEKKVKA